MKYRLQLMQQPATKIAAVSLLASLELIVQVRPSWEHNTYAMSKNTQKYRTPH